MPTLERIQKWKRFVCLHTFTIPQMLFRRFMNIPWTDGENSCNFTTLWPVFENNLQSKLSPIFSFNFKVANSKRKMFRMESSLFSYWLILGEILTNVFVVVVIIAFTTRYQRQGGKCTWKCMQFPIFLCSAHPKNDVNGERKWITYNSVHTPYLQTMYPFCLLALRSQPILETDWPVETRKILLPTVVYCNTIPSKVHVGYYRRMVSFSFFFS